MWQQCDTLLLEDVCNLEMMTCPDFPLCLLQGSPWFIKSKRRLQLSCPPPTTTLPHILPLKDAWIITLGSSSNCSEQLTTLLGNLFNVEWHELLKVTVGFWLKLLLLNHFYFSVLIGTVQNSLLIPTASLCVWLLSTVSLWYFLLGEKYQAQPQLHFSVDCKAVSQCYDTNMLLSGLVTGGHFIHGSTCS